MEFCAKNLDQIDITSKEDVKFRTMKHPEELEEVGLKWITKRCHCNLGNMTSSPVTAGDARLAVRKATIAGVLPGKLSQISDNSSFWSIR